MSAWRWRWRCARGSAPRFAVTVVDPALAPARPTATRAPRRSRRRPRRLFERLGVWDEVAAEAQPILDMVVTDSRLDDAVRPVFLTFAGDVEPGEPFAHMVRERPPGRRRWSPRAREAAACGLEPRRGRATSRRWRRRSVVARRPTAAALAARLLVAADGARSRLRELAGIATHGWSYGQSGIVTTVAHERDHDGRAEEHFLPAGPFAILPLTGRRSSIVWTEESERRRAHRRAAPTLTFHAELERRFGLQLGEIEAVGPRRAYPLGLHVARDVRRPSGLRWSAMPPMCIHPIAGQGLNLGLRDVAALAEAVVDAARLGLDPGAAATCSSATSAGGASTPGDGGRDRRAQPAVLQPLRRAAPRPRHRARPGRPRCRALKRLFIREAAGLVGEVPRLLRGEAL